jgi:hypothetical protein
MATSCLSITCTIATVYRDVWRVLLAMRKLVVCALLIILAVKVAEDLIPLRAWSGPIHGKLLGFVAEAVQSFCLTPYLIAVHRFIILDEVTAGYAPDPSQPRFMSFFGWLLALSALSTLAFALQELLTAIGLSAVAAIASTVVALIMVLIVSMRLTILFPAIAIDARGANASNALADTKSHVFRIFMIFLLALLPCAAIAVAVTLMLGPGVYDTGTPVALVHLVVGAVITTITISLCVAIASRVFQALAGRVLRQT